MAANDPRPVELMSIIMIKSCTSAAASSANFQLRCCLQMAMLGSILAIASYFGCSLLLAFDTCRLGWVLVLFGWMPSFAFCFVLFLGTAMLDAV